MRLTEIICCVEDEKISPVLCSCIDIRNKKNREALKELRAEALAEKRKQKALF